MRTIGWGLSLVGLTSLMSFLVPNAMTSLPVGAGGFLGLIVQTWLSEHLATLGGLLLSSAIALAGMMMWTEYLVFRTGRIVFAPAIVAATALLPFGLLNRMVRWVNGERSLDVADSGDFTNGSDLPRTIRVKGSDGAAAEVSYGLRGTSVAAKDTVADKTKSPVETVVDEDEEYEYEEDEVVDETDSADESLEETPQLANEGAVHAKPHFTVHHERTPKAKSEREVVMDQLNQAADAESDVDYALPAINLLQNGTSVSFDDQKREALQKAEILEKTCKEFGYNVRVVEIETGPVISQYEIQLEAGLRLQKITALADDLAIALRVPSVRIVAPIPGKNTVGVEVPNESRELVRLREVIEQSEEKTRKMKIPLFLGKDVVGSPMVVDLASLPHLLIAGRTGTGKSVCLNAIITSILMTRRPDEVRMLMIDPKMVELSGYGRLPHLMHPVVTDMKKAEAILAWAVDKMEERYALLARAGVRHVVSYNQLGHDELMERLQPENEEEQKNIPTHLPFIVIVADEMADLMMTAGKEVEQHIIRLAQKSRAVGIHLILATQKPTVDVITGLIKSNLPARIAFQVASRTDSRVVLDEMGADKLLGNGDMLFLWPGTSNLLRGQGTYLSDEEIESVTESVSTTEQNFVQELLHIKVEKEDDGGGSSKGAIPDRDDLYEDAIEIVIREGRGSVSLLQRSLRIGYGRAARLIDFMAEDGIVGAYNGSNARDVVMTMADWESRKYGGAEPEIETPSIETTSTTRSLGIAASDSAAPSKSKRPVNEPEAPHTEDDDYEAYDDDMEYEDYDE
ncbi:MAG: DNA translocase FtsK [Pirellulaceae bacterium]